MPPELLHRVITTCGLEDCTEVVALATPGQLARILDIDIGAFARQAPTNNSTPIGLACG